MKALQKIQRMLPITGVALIVSAAAGCAANGYYVEQQPVVVQAPGYPPPAPLPDPPMVQGTTPVAVYGAEVIPTPAPAFLCQAPPVVAAVPLPAPVVLTEDQIDQLVAPIALYPDPLIAQILPAATYPTEVVAAAQWRQAYPTVDEASIDVQPWEPPVRAVAHYPAVLQMMANNLAWTESLGAAFLNQQGDVIQSIQRLRLQAQAAGALMSTPQQVVIVNDGAICIEPASPEVVFVPRYDPDVIFWHRREGERFEFSNVIHFDAGGFHLGIWLNNDIDWDHHWVAAGGGWHNGWRPEEVRRDMHVAEPPPTRPWARNDAKPRPVLPARVEEEARRPVADDAHRGRPGTPAPAPGVAPARAETPRFVMPTPGHPEPVRPAAPATPTRRPPEVVRPAPPVTPPVVRPTPAPVVRPTPAPVVRQAPPLPAPPAPKVFGPYQSGAQVQHDVQRAQQSHVAPAPPPAPAAPAPRPYAAPPPASHTPTPAAPAPRPAVTERPPTPAPAPAVHTPAPAPPAAHTPTPPAPAPRPVVAERPPTPAPAARTPAPAPVRAAPAAAPTPVLRPPSSPAAVQAQSTRGNDSLQKQQQQPSPPPHR